MFDSATRRVGADLAEGKTLLMRRISSVLVMMRMRKMLSLGRHRITKREREKR